MANQTLKDKTLTLLMASDKTLMVISKESGVPFTWLNTFKCKTRRPRSPGVDNVQKLYEYLSGKKLDV